MRRFALLLLLGAVATSTSADVKVKREHTNSKAAQTAQKALHLNAARNIESLVAELELSSAQKAKVKALTSESQWKQAVSEFKMSRGDEIHGHAHQIVRQTIPGLMRKFMPSYMRSKIMASRRKGRRGPPSKAEISQIQKDARTKIEPVMRKTVMPALDKLKETRVNELLQDEKILTRMLADRIIKADVLGKEGTKAFSRALDKAGYPASLCSGADAELNDRTKTMVNAIDLKQIVKAAGL